MFSEVNTKSNLPAQIELYATKGSEYKFQFMAKGGEKITFFLVVFAPFF
jgi:fumarate hydratase class I